MSGIITCTSGCLLNTANTGALILTPKLAGYGLGYWTSVGNTGLQIGWNSIISSSGSTEFLNNSQSNTTGGFIFSTTNSSNTNVSSQICIRPGPVIGIGTINPIANLHIASTNNGGYIYIGANATTGYSFNNDATNSLVIYKGVWGAQSPQVSLTGTSWVSGSDIRIKTNIVPVENVLDKIMLVNPVTYNMLDDPSNNTTHYGFIAQDFIKLFPHLVIGMPDPKMDDGQIYGIAYTPFVAVLTQAIKEQQLLIQDLQSNIQTQQNTIQTQQTTIDTILQRLSTAGIT
jgi:hypothetical protein